MNIFPTAAEARAGSRNNLAIHDEIRALETSIYTAIDQGKLNVDVSNSPFTTLPAEDAPDSDINAYDYFAALFDENGDRSLKEQIDLVQKNFVDLGYQVQPLANTNSGFENTFFWRILW